MADANAKEPYGMKCTIQGCPGEYEERTVTHTARHNGSVVIIDHVPAEVCLVCGDVLLAPQTIRRIEHMLETPARPDKTVPLYEYA